MKYLLDTCVISELVKKKPDPKVVSWLREQDESALFLSVLTFGELEKGLAKVGDPTRQERLRNWVDHDLKRRFLNRIVEFEYEAASRWGLITGEAENNGTPVPVVDGQLAATALVHGLIMVTRNTADVQPTHVPVLNPWLA